MKMSRRPPPPPNHNTVATSKLPVRRNIAPLFKMADELEKHLEKLGVDDAHRLKTNKIYKKFSANFDGRVGGGSDAPSDNDYAAVEKVTNKNWKATVSKFAQIFRLIIQFRPRCSSKNATNKLKN